MFHVHFMKNQLLSQPWKKFNRERKNPQSAVFVKIDFKVNNWKRKIISA